MDVHNFDECEVTIEFLTEDKINDALQLWSNLNGIHLHSDGEDSYESIKEFLDRNPECSFAAFSQGKMIGAVLGGHDGRRGFVYHLGVDENYRRRGIATQLLSHIEKKFESLGIKKEVLFALQENRSAHEFYRSIGWNEETSVKTFRKPI